MAECQELAGAVYERLKHYARQPNITNFDGAVAGLLKDFPQLDRQQIVDHIVNVSSNKAKEIPAFQKKLSMMKGEVRKEHKLVKAIEELEAVLDQQAVLSKTSNPTKEPSETVRLLREKRDNLKAAYNESPPAIVEKLQKQINDIQERLSANDYALPVSKTNLPSSIEVMKLEQKKKELQSVGRKKIQRLRDEQHTKKAMLRESYNLTKAMRSSFDAGFLGRQGLLVAVSHPKMAFNALGDAAIAAWNPDQAARMEAEMMENEQAIQFMSGGGRLATDTDLNEESFAGRVDGMLMDQIRKIPGFNMAAGTTLGSVSAYATGKIHGGMKASERAHRTFLNKLRVDYYTQLAATLPSLGDPTPAEARTIANLVNTATGYGDWEALGSSMQTAQNVMWSARYQLSRLQMLVGSPLWSAPSAGHKTNLALGLKIDANKALVAQEYARMFSGMIGLGTLMGIAATGYNHDPEEEFEDNLTASRFWTARFGDTYVDFSSGLRTYVTMISRIVSGKLETRSGKVQDVIGEDTKQVTASDLSYSFARGKLAPLSAAGADLVLGRPFDDNTRPHPARIVADLTVPLPADAFVEELVKGGFTRATGRTLADFAGLPSID